MPPRPDTPSAEPRWRPDGGARRASVRSQTRRARSFTSRNWRRAAPAAAGSLNDAARPVSADRSRVHRERFVHDPADRSRRLDWAGGLFEPNHDRACAVSRYRRTRANPGFGVHRGGAPRLPGRWRADRTWSGTAVAIAD